MAGTYVQWCRQLSDYPAGSGWALSYALVKPGKLITFNATPSGDLHLVTLTKTTTENYEAGSYAWQAFVEKDDERHLVGTGTIEIKPNYAAMAAAGYDGRSHVVKVRDALRAMVEGRATKEQRQTVVAGQVIEYMPVAQLLTWLNKYEADAKNEERAERITKGLGHDGNIYVRFTE